MIETPTERSSLEFGGHDPDSLEASRRGFPGDRRLVVNASRIDFIQVGEHCAVCQDLMFSSTRARAEVDGEVELIVLMLLQVLEDSRLFLGPFECPGLSV